METQTIFVTLEMTRCCQANCGVVFGIEQGHRARLRSTHETFYCPNGHPQHFTAITEEERLRRELKAIGDNRDWWKDRARDHELSARSLKGVITRTKRRVGHGVCPCCTRTFQNLAAHIETKHPDYVNPSPRL